MKDWLDWKGILTGVVVSLLGWGATRAIRPLRELMLLPVPLWTAAVAAVLLLTLLVFATSRRRRLDQTIAALRHNVANVQLEVDHYKRVAQSAEAALIPLRERGDQLSAMLDDCRMGRDALAEQVRGLREEQRNEHDPDFDPPRPPIR